MWMLHICAIVQHKTAEAIGTLFFAFIGNNCAQSKRLSFVNTPL
ncbi:Uncharacterised protein [Segatella copri]|nr:Uncharacterised protein [Segatella copri]